MDQTAFLKRSGRRLTYFDIQPRSMNANPSMADGIRTSYESFYKPYRSKIMNESIQRPHTMKVLGLKPYPVIQTLIQKADKDALHTGGMKPSQGHGRHMDKGLSFNIYKDRVSGSLLKQADSHYAGLNNSIKVPN